MEAQRPGLFAEGFFVALGPLSILFQRDALVVGLPGSEQVVDAAGKFVGGSGMLAWRVAGGAGMFACRVGK